MFIFASHLIWHCVPFACLIFWTYFSFIYNVGYLKNTFYFFPPNFNVFPITLFSRIKGKFCNYNVFTIVTFYNSTHKTEIYFLFSHLILKLKIQYMIDQQSLHKYCKWKCPMVIKKKKIESKHKVTFSVLLIFYLESLNETTLEKVP